MGEKAKHKKCVRVASKCAGGALGRVRGEEREVPLVGGAGGRGSYSAARPACDMATGGGSNSKTGVERVQANSQRGCAAAVRSLASQN